MFVWFPAAWMPLVDAIRLSGGCAVAFTNALHTRILSNKEFSFKLKRWQVDCNGQRVLQSSQH